MQNILLRTYYVPRMNYVSNVRGSCRDVHIKEPISVHRRAVKVLRAASQMLPGPGHTSANPLLLKQQLQYDKCILVHKVVHNKSPAYLRQLLHARTRGDVNSKSSIFVLPKTGIDLCKMSFSHSGSYR